MSLSVKFFCSAVWFNFLLLKNNILVSDQAPVTDSRNRNKLVITSFLKPTSVCPGTGLNCFAVCKTRGAMSASLFRRRAGREHLEETSFIQADSSGFVYDTGGGNQVSFVLKGDCSVWFCAWLPDVGAEGEGAEYLS